jgi:hypothetical protein
MKSFIILTILFVSALSAAENCWKKTQGRGAGLALHACAKGLVNDNSICRTPCKAGYNGVVTTCVNKSKRTDTYQRGAGSILICDLKKEVYQDGLCYKPCPPNSKGQGPVCWGQCLPSMFDCGLMCTADSAACSKINKENLARVGKLILSIAMTFIGIIDVQKIIKNTKDVALGFNLPSCPNVR